MKRKLSKKTQAAVALGAAAVVAVGGTFAWFSTTDQVENVFDMDDFDVSITEAFDPETPMNPGSTITKQVGVTNYGDVPVYVRVKFEEKLVLKNWALNEEDDKRLLYYADTKTPSGKEDLFAKDGTAYPEGTGFEKAIPAVYDEKVIKQFTTGDWSEVQTPDLGSGFENVKVYTKESTASGEGANTVHQYFAYDTTDNQIVEIKAMTDDGGTTTYTAKYAYHVVTDEDREIESTHAMKDFEANDALIHGENDKWIKFNFAEAFTGNESDNWILDTDAENNKGYYYYKHVLDAGESTPNLLDSVTFGKEMPNSFLGAVYTITPVMEAVQENGDAVDATWDVAGTYDVEVTDGDDPLGWVISN